MQHTRLCDIFLENIVNDSNANCTANISLFIIIFTLNWIFCSLLSKSCVIYIFFPDQWVFYYLQLNNWIFILIWGFFPNFWHVLLFDFKRPVVNIQMNYWSQAFFKYHVNFMNDFIFFRILLWIYWILLTQIFLFSSLKERSSAVRLDIL